MGFKGVIHVDVKHQDTINFEVVELWNGNVDNHFPFVWNCDVLSCLRQNAVCPVGSVTPESDFVFSDTISIVLWTVVSASDTIDVNPFMNSFVTTTDTNKQISGVGVVVVVTILACCG